MGNEKYPFPGYPRGHLLYGTLSPLKHWIKNWVFNDSWAMLESGATNEEVASRFKEETLSRILELGNKAKYDMYPIHKQVPPIREVHRAWTKVSKGHPREEELREFRDIVCYILNEDDGYRFRFQWMAEWFPLWVKKNPIKYIEVALNMMEHAEVVNDMKERIRLLRRVSLVLFADQGIRSGFTDFAQEIDWRKIKLSKADKYYFRAKYFKVDYRKFDY